MRNLNLEQFELPALLELLERYLQILEHVELANDDETAATWAVINEVEKRRQLATLSKLTVVGVA